MNGPLAGTGAPAGSRWVVVGKSPMAVPEQYASGNLGGSFGAALKWAGLDGIDIFGASREPIIMIIEPAGSYRCEPAHDLWGKDALQTIGLLEERFGANARVVAIGRAGETKVRFATIIGSEGVSATKGFGAVMGSKNLKAIVVVPAARSPLSPAQPEAFKQVRQEITALWQGEASGRFWNELSLEDIEMKKQVPCYGCPGICRRGMYESSLGEQGIRKPCVSAYYYFKQEMDKTGRMAATTFHATQLANMHGLCILELRFLVNWLPAAIKTGAVDPKEPGLDLALLGTPQWIDTLVELITNRRGIGDLLAEGSRRSTRELGVEDLIEGLVTRTGFDADYYNPRLFINNAPIYATEPVYPITQLHRVSFPMVKWMVWMGTEGMMGFLTTEKLRLLAKKFWGDVRAAEFDTPDCKGAAAVLMQNRSYAIENMVMCDWFWPLDFTANTQSGTGELGLEARLFSAVTGQPMDEDGFLRTGERCANLCRAIYLREGRRGRADDVLEDFNYTRPLQDQDPPVGLFNADLVLPGKNGELFSRKGKTVDRDVFEKIMDEYYRTRGWDVPTGLASREKLKALELDDIIPGLAEKGLLAGQ
jgi:aldehyde:ferredoxin oxidoreductase